MLCNKTIISEDCQQNVGNILDLLKLRHHNCTAFSYEEIQCMLTDLCTSENTATIYICIKCKTSVLIFVSVFVFICLNVQFTNLIVLCVRK